MYLSATRFERLLKLRISDLESVNLKQLLNDEFNVPTLAVHQTAVLKIPAKEIGKHISVSSRTACLLLRIVATSRRRDPISFQRIYVPPVHYEMELSETPFETARSLAA
jgi:DNA-binding GntR family transcriptional regulator